MKKLFAALIVMILAGCSSTRVSIEYDKDVDFSQYHTFTVSQAKMQQPRKGAVQNPFFKKETLAEISGLLTERGFEKSAKDKADLNVIFYAYTRHQSTYIAPSYHVGRRGRVWRSGGRTVHHQEGALIIDIVDAQRKELIWRGVGKDVLRPDMPAQDLVKVVDDILKDFPPGS